MDNNFTAGIVAAGKDIGRWLAEMPGNEKIISFIAGAVFAFLLAGFVVSEDPRNVPIILRRSQADGFQKIADRDPRGTYQMAYSRFAKTHMLVRALFALAAASFFLMVAAIVYIYGG